MTFSFAIDARGIGNPRKLREKADMDSNHQRQWLEDACASLFPPECAFDVQPYDGDEIFLPSPEDAALTNAVPKRKREFSAGRTAARAALLKLGIESQAIPVGPNRNPVWPADIVGSITHTAGFAVAAVARRNLIAGLGIDLEIADAANSGLWQEILTEIEINRVSALPGDRQKCAATTIFCAKESFYKLQHPLTGCWLDFHDAEVEFTPEAGSFQLTCTETQVTARLRQSVFPGCFISSKEFVLTAMHLAGANKPGLA